MFKLRLVISIFLLVITPELLLASELEKIQVYGSRQDIYKDPWDSNTLIQREQIETYSHLDLADLLRQVAGIELFRTGSQSGSASLFLRGSESKHVLVYIDNTKVNDPSDPSKRFDFSRFPASLIESIEILRGPQSGRLGSESVGGIIRVTTLKGGSKNLSLGFGLGSFERIKSFASFKGEVSEDITLGIAGGFSKSRGYSALSSRLGGTEADGFESHELSINSKIAIDDNNQIRIHGMKTQLNNEEDLSQPNFDDPNAESNRALEIYSLGYKYSNLRQELSLSTSYSLSDSFNSNPKDSINDFSTEESYKGKISFSEINHIYYAKFFKITYGIQYESEDLRIRFNSIEIPEKIRDELSIYTEYSQNLWSNSDFNIRLRADEFKNYWRGSYYTSISQSIGESIQFSLVAATGHKKPSLYELFSNFGNPNLDTEFVSSQELNFSYSSKFFRNSIHFFKSEISNLIQFNSNAYTNIKKSRQSGVELRTKLQIDRTISLNTQIRYLESIDIETGELLPRRPRLYSYASFTKTFLNGLTSNLNYQYVGKRADIDFINFNRKTLSPYDVVNLSFRKEFDKNWKLAVNINNIFGKNYESVDGYKSPQINYFIGLKWEKAY